MTHMRPKGKRQYAECLSTEHYCLLPYQIRQKIWFTLFLFSIEPVSKTPTASAIESVIESQNHVVALLFIFVVGVSNKYNSAGTKGP